MPKTVTKKVCPKCGNPCEVQELGENSFKVICHVRACRMHAIYYDSKSKIPEGQFTPDDNGQNPA